MNNRLKDFKFEKWKFDQKISKFGAVNPPRTHENDNFVFKEEK